MSEIESNLQILMRTLRRRLHLSQEGLAQKLGVSRGSVNRWENGRGEPSQAILNSIHHLWESVCDEDEPEARTSYLNNVPQFRQSDVMRILGVSHQRVRILRIRQTLKFYWDEEMNT
ncbi:putative XRE family transcriptional regulator [Arthrospira platensis NIES-46]|uniref:XRE family transcriptional regulator n=1 Tax=Limnospira platensis NIES-46 TaxID=1236695 RepID=A0A5M3T7I1_LIMPL|nr:helix-turn-helix transcriptional regulator [Arthrospira platensis]GCE93756.1 putative XRE family transcriptional regulator [Arthrospira platensis NIES-46]